MNELRDKLVALRDTARETLTLAIDELPVDNEPRMLRARFMPMVNCGWPSGMLSPGVTYEQSVVAGLRAWQAVADTAIVLTRVGNVTLYDRLANDVPGMKIIPGLLATSVMTTFDDRVGWTSLIQEVTRIITETGCTTYALDFEEVLEEYVAGNQRLNLRDATYFLAQLPRNITYIVYPSTFWVVAGEYEKSTDRIDRLVEVCQRIDMLLDVWWIAEDFARPDLVEDPRTEYAHDKLAQFAEQTPAQLVWMYGTPSNWRDDHLVYLLERIYKHDPKAVAYIYLGNERFAEGSEVLAKILAE